MKVNFKHVVITALFFAILVMTTAFATFSSRIVLRGNASLGNSGQVAKWDVAIVNVNATTQGNAVSQQMSYNRLSANFAAILCTDGDYIEYNVTVQNKGTIDAKLDSIISDVESTNTGSSAIIYEMEGLTVGDVLLAGKSQTFKIRVSYDADLEVNSLLNSRAYWLTVSYVQKV